MATSAWPISTARSCPRAISFRDTGFLYGAGVFDTTRTFGHKPFRLGDHVRRLFHSLKAAGIDPGLDPEQTLEITEAVLARNLHLIDPDDDYWLTQRITRGVKIIEGDLTAVGDPTVIVECTPLPLKARSPEAWAILLDTNGNLCEGTEY